ncbi:MAG: hypothetical protein M1815_001970 [Lichina confinis]|nr:MAG: hypothetical protein M1815_001970 [Lichina confinis]
MGFPSKSRARRASQPQGQQLGLPATGHYNPGSTLVVPPLQFLQAARKLGMLHTPPRNTHAFLQAYVALGPKPAVGRVEKLCEQLKIDLPALPYIPISLILTSIGATSFEALAIRLLLTAVDLKLPLATYFLVNTILRRKKDKTSFVSRPEFGPAIRDLESRASGGEDRIAIILWGRLLMARGDDDQAMKVFRQAVELDKERDGHLEDDVPDEVDERLIRGSSLGQAYLHLGRWHLKRHKPDSLTEAESYLRVAAEQYDDADAWLERFHPAHLPASEKRG